MKLQQVRNIIGNMIQRNALTIDIYKNQIEGPTGRRAYNRMIRNLFEGYDASVF